MAQTRMIDNPAQSGPGIPDEALAPGEEAGFESELEQAEAEQDRDEAERHPFGENRDGIGPTLGEDVGAPTPGRDIPGDDDDDA